MSDDLVKRPCTCQPDDDPPRPCPQQYAFRDCVEKAKLEQLERESSACDMVDGMRQEVQTMTNALGFTNREIERLKMGLENCRLLAARHRKEAWALLILGFCAEAGVVGSVTRDTSDHHGPDWTERDGEYLK